MKKHRATATLSWQFEGDAHSALENARAYLNQVLNAPNHVKVSLKVDRLKDDEKAKIILGEFDPNEVLPFVRNDQDKRTYRVGDLSYEVRMNSHRYFIFRSSQECAACGLLGTKMLLEQHPNDKSPHFNLYGVEDGVLVLMTKDHIRAKSFGGEDRHSNYQTMCAICNNLKGNDNLNLEGLKQLRDLYNQNVKVLSRKKLNALINGERERLKNPDFWERTSKCRWHRVSAESKSKDLVIAKVDLLIMESLEGLVGMSVYESADKGANMHPIACIQKGTLLKPSSFDNQHIVVEFNDTHFKLFHGYLEHHEFARDLFPQEHCSDEICSKSNG